jgi:hypothetical protein
MMVARSMVEAPPAPIYDYSPQQAELVRLYERYRRCSMDQKYYAWRLARYQFWNTATDLFAGATMLISLATRDSTAWVSNGCYALGAIAALIFIGKPILKVSEQIEKYTSCTVPMVNCSPEWKTCLRTYVEVKA